MNSLPTRFDGRKTVNTCPAPRNGLWAHQLNQVIGVKFTRIVSTTLPSSWRITKRDSHTHKTTAYVKSLLEYLTRMAATTADQSGRVVLIALDGSDRSTYAFETYLKSLKYPDDVVLLVTCKELSKVVSSFWNKTVFSYDPEILQEKLKAEEEAKKAMLKPYGDKLQEVGIKFKPLILVSQNPGYSIVNTAQAENAGLIVMGSRGHGTLRRTLVGSCSDYVINHTSAIPVVICRQGS